MQVYVAAIVAPHTRGTQVWIGTLPAHYIMPLRRLHDSGAGYKYPDLLTDACLPVVVVPSADHQAGH